MFHAYFSLQDYYVVFHGSHSISIKFVVFIIKKEADGFIPTYKFPSARGR